MSSIPQSLDIKVDSVSIPKKSIPLCVNQMLLGHDYGGHHTARTDQKLYNDLVTNGFNHRCTTCKPDAENNPRCRCYNALSPGTDLYLP